MARRDDDYDDRDDYDDDRPRRRRRRDDDYDDDYDRPRRRHRSELTGLDGMFANTSMVALVLFGLCCGNIALILGIVGLAVCKDETARKNAMIVTIISAVYTVIAVAIVVIQIASGKPVFGR